MAKENRLTPNLAVLLNYPLKNAKSVGTYDFFLEMLSKSLTVFGHVYIVSPRDDTHYPLKETRMSVIANGCSRGLLYYPSILFDIATLVRLVRKNNVKIIRALATTSGFAAVLAGKLTGTPVVVSVHADRKISAKDQGRGSALKNALIQLTESFVLKNADRVLVISSYIKNYVLTQGVDPKKVEDHPNCVHTDLFKPGKKRGPVVFFAGRLTRVKGGVEAISAMPAVLKKHPRAVLEIAGEGEEKNDLVALSKQLRVEKSVRFLGRLDHDTQLPKRMATCAVFICPQTGGFSLIEAMSCGLPVVAADVEWSREVIADGKTGYLVKAGDVAALSDRINRVLSNPKQSAVLGKSARKIVEKKFSFQAWADRERRIYTELLKRN